MTWEKGSGELLGHQISNPSPTQETVFDLTTMLDNVDVTKLDPAVCGRKLASTLSPLSLSPFSAFSRLSVDVQVVKKQM